MRKIKEVLKNTYRLNPNIKIVTVTKKKTVEDILKASEVGLNIFGENYLQEAQEKILKLKNKNFSWHFIGRIQSKKLNQIVGVFKLIHSVDREKLIDKIESIANEKSLVQDILLQVNTSKEESKGGFEKSEIEKVISHVNGLHHINVRGLMCMPALSEDLDKVKNEFKDLKTIFENVKKKISSQHNFTELSMGTSGDYLLAIEEGATIIRLGRVLLGERS